MQIYDAITEMASTAGKSIYRIQKEIGKPKIIDTSKCRGSILRSDSLACIAEACGYKLVVVPESDIPDTAIEISSVQK